MHHVSLVRARPTSGGFVTTGTLIVASASTLFLTLMTGCHSAPATSAFASSAADMATQARLLSGNTMTHLQAFDEQFWVEPADSP